MHLIPPLPTPRSGPPQFVEEKPKKTLEKEKRPKKTLQKEKEKKKKKLVLQQQQQQHQQQQQQQQHQQQIHHRMKLQERAEIEHLKLLNHHQAMSGRSTGGTPTLSYVAELG